MVAVYNIFTKQCIYEDKQVVAKVEAQPLSPLMFWFAPFWFPFTFSLSLMGLARSS